MKRNTVWCRVALLLVALLCVGCREPGGARPASGAEADCVVNGSRIWFADEQQRQAWQQPLAELLSRVSEWDDRADFEEILDPDAPALPQSYRCGPPSPSHSFRFGVFAAIMRRHSSTPS